MLHALQMINNKTKEHLEIETRLAEIALRAAQYAVNFASIGGSDGKVQLPDLMRVFKKVSFHMRSATHACPRTLACTSPWTSYLRTLA